jgi:hypothetical protein
MTEEELHKDCYLIEFLVRNKGDFIDICVSRGETEESAESLYSMAYSELSDNISFTLGELEMIDMKKKIDGTAWGREMFINDLGKIIITLYPVNEDDCSEETPSIWVDPQSVPSLINDLQAIAGGEADSIVRDENDELISGETDDVIA